MPFWGPLLLFGRTLRSIPFAPFGSLSKGFSGDLFQPTAVPTTNRKGVSKRKTVPGWFFVGAPNLLSTTSCVTNNQWETDSVWKGGGLVIWWLGKDFKSWD